MSAIAEWGAISARISGLLEAGNFFLTCQGVRSDDPHGAGKLLVRHANEVFATLKAFDAACRSELPPAAIDTLSSFLTRYVSNFGSVPQEPRGSLQFGLTALSLFRAQFACERLGAVHLLIHGIWAFKADAAGERTDLVFGEPLTDLAAMERAADALVLTEWKKARTSGEVLTQLAAAKSQASRYVRGALGGLELARYRSSFSCPKKLLRSPLMSGMVR